MMKLITGKVTVATAGTRVPVSVSRLDVRWIRFEVIDGASHVLVLGDSTVVEATDVGTIKRFAPGDITTAPLDFLELGLPGNGNLIDISKLNADSANDAGQLAWSALIG